MTVINGGTLLQVAPIKDMAREKYRDHGVSYGLGEAGYDIRIKQEIRFVPHGVYGYYPVKETEPSARDTHRRVGFSRKLGPFVSTKSDLNDFSTSPGNFVIASAIEEFNMPANLVGVVHDKSTWARLGLSVFNTVIEPGWRGKLTLELVYHGSGELIIPAGSGIAQVVFSELSDPGDYGDGKYQDQEDGPVSARFA